MRFVLFNNKNFNEPFDGIVYAVMVSMGFATLENILYVFHSGFTTGVIRMFTAVPAHATFGALMGYFLGKAKFSYNRKLFFTLMALLTATAFHGSYDYLVPRRSRRCMDRHLDRRNALPDHWLYSLACSHQVASTGFTFIARQQEDALRQSER